VTDPDDDDCCGSEEVEYFLEYIVFGCGCEEVEPANPYADRNEDEGRVEVACLEEEGCFDEWCDLDAWTRVRLDGGGGRPHDLTVLGRAAFRSGVV
jgi:hypothetical protein